MTMIQKTITVIQQYFCQGRIFSNTTHPQKFWTSCKKSGIRWREQRTVSYLWMLFNSKFHLLVWFQQGIDVRIMFYRWICHAWCSWYHICKSWSSKTKDSIPEDEIRYDAGKSIGWISLPIEYDFKQCEYSKPAISNSRLETLKSSLF